MIRPLFSTGIARGGTNLVAKMLNVCPEVYLAVDPFLATFRQFRDDAIRRSGDPELIAALDPQGPLDDYYYSPLKLRLMDLVQATDPAMPYDLDRHAELVQILAPRTALASVNLVPYIDGIAGATYADVWRNAVGIIAKAVGAERRRWVGWHDCWAVEFFTPLAKAFPDAKFLLIVRDPRATLASAITSPDRPELIPHSLSYVRNWRKLVAFAAHYQRDPLLRDRILVVRYENVVTSPEAAARELTDFLGVPYDPGMIDARNFRDGAGRPWGPNSSWQGVPGQIYASSVDTWKRRLAPEIVELSDLVCDPEMRMYGYAPEVEPAPLPSEACLRFVERDGREHGPQGDGANPKASGGWRIGQPEVSRDIGVELVRRALLADGAARSDDWIRRCFLFTEVFAAVRDLLAERSSRRPVASAVTA